MRKRDAVVEYFARRLRLDARAEVRDCHARGRGEERTSRQTRAKHHSYTNLMASEARSRSDAPGSLAALSVRSCIAGSHERGRAGPDATSRH